MAAEFTIFRSVRALIELRRVVTAIDAAGNLTNDTLHVFSFDAENKIRTVNGSSAYVYNGEGQRVRKLLAENRRFIYGIGGEEIAEFDGGTGVLKKEYIYGANGLVLAHPFGCAILEDISIELRRGHLY